MDAQKLLLVDLYAQFSIGINTQLWVSPVFSCCLVGVRKTAHARHDAEHVVVERIDANLRRAVTRDRVERDRELERRLVDTGEVTRAGRLVLLGAESERVDVDTRGRRAAVVLVRLNLVEVRALTLREAILAVELELGNLNRVLALAANTRVKDHLGEEVVDTRVEVRLLAVREAVGVDISRTERVSTREGTAARDEVGGDRAAKRRR